MTDALRVHRLFNKLIDESPNELTLIIRCHHAIEKEIHMALEQALPRSERLDMRRIPFLTKVDLLIALSIIRSDLFPLFAETNRLRNRFAHDPNAAFTDEDVNKIRALIKSQPRKIVSPDLKWGDAKRTVAILLNIVHVNVRVGFEASFKEPR